MGGSRQEARMWILNSGLKYVKEGIMHCVTYRLSRLPFEDRVEMTQIHENAEEFYLLEE